MRFDPRLSSVRGLAAGSVAASHGADMSLHTTAFAFLGWVGVAAFLALSIRLLVPKLDEAPALGPYFRRRALRIWPLYWATCLAAFIVFDRDLTRLVLNAAFVAIYVPGAQFPTGLAWAPAFVLWTLQVEEAAYLTFPLVAHLGNVGRRRLGFGLVGVSVAYAIAVEWGPWGHAYVVTGGYGLPLAWLGCYGVGLLALGSPPGAPWTTPGLALAAVAALPAMPFEFGILLALPLVYGVLRSPPAWLDRMTLVAIGEVSYALYLLHVVVFALLGPLGLAAAVPVAGSVEFATRGRSIAARVRSAGRSHYSVGGVT